MNCKNWLGNKSAATSALAGSNFYPRFPRPPRENSSASNCANSKVARPKMRRSVRCVSTRRFFSCEYFREKSPPRKEFTNRKGSYQQTDLRDQSCKRSDLEQQIAGGKAAVHATRQALRRRRL